MGQDKISIAQSFVAQGLQNHEKNIEVVHEAVLRSPRKSLHHQSQELNLSLSSTQIILKEELKMYLYRIQVKQKINYQTMINNFV